jgi:cell division protein FtsL
MFEILSATLLTALAVMLNTYATRRADRSSARRKRLESDWSRIIAGAARDMTVKNRD